VFANGGVFTYEDYQKCLEHTKADGVMSSEALLENPALF
jgi:tRNA-dihydrouridine synthase 1